ncbi:RICIN domain-containing protein [Streptomyces sp. NPDC057557]|uniref:RICIN domain-containing protein n=1 Tax=Streptomyces sp. NPDC057557 TaxID=3346167 RepID=UPI00368A34BC
MRTRWGIRVRATLVALSAVAAFTATGQPTAAAAEGDPFVEADRSPFNLYPREIPGIREGEGDTARGIIESLEASGSVTRASVLSVAQSRQHVGRGLCHTTGLNGTFKYNGFCWDGTDDVTSAYDPAGGWHPQGLTASHDAYAGGTLDGHHLYMTSWYYGTGQETRDQKARISIAESTGTDRSYGHVLLVKPFGSRGNPNFEAVDRVHADGIAWYGDRLFVANGGELQIYDLNHLWRMTTLARDVGVGPGTSFAANHQWALPMVARYGTRTLAQEEASDNPHVRACELSRACLSSLSLDRSGSKPRLVSGEYWTNKQGYPARVVKWPLENIAEGNTATVKAEAAYVAHVRQLQGVATDGVYYYLSAQCPDGYMGDADTSDYGSYACIWQATPGHRPTVLTRAPSVTQNLSYAQSSGRLWGANELTGKRVVFSLRPREADRAVYLSNDYSALCAGAGNKITNSSPVIQWGCTNAQDERWLFEDTTDSNGNRAYFLRNAYSGKCMGTGSSLANGAGMIQYTCNDAVDEKWWWSPETGELRNVYSGKCLGLGAAATKGSQLIQWTCNGAADEKWSQTARNV